MTAEATVRDPTPADGPAADPTLTDQDRFAAAHSRIARQLFAICGEAGAAGGSPAAAVTLTSLAGQFAWHAELFYELLPVRAGVDRDALVDAVADGADEALNRVAALAAGGELDVVCVVLARVVVPRLAAAVHHAGQLVDPRVDGARSRTLMLVFRDLVDALLALEPLCEVALAQPDGFEVGARVAAEVERGLVAAGVAIGLVAHGRGG